jgi:hypothetical protein
MPPPLARPPTPGKRPAGEVARRVAVRGGSVRGSCGRSPSRQAARYSPLPARCSRRRRLARHLAEAITCPLRAQPFHPEQTTPAEMWHFAGTSSKPTPGLEPGTPSLRAASGSGRLRVVCGSRRKNRAIRAAFAGLCGSYPGARRFHKASRANHGPSVGALLLWLKAGVSSVPLRTAAFRPQRSSRTAIARVLLFAQSSSDGAR